MPQFHNSQIPPPTDWQEFERLCCDLWREIWQYPNTKKNGRQGQTQHGVDIYGRYNNKWAGVQCKGKDNYSDKNLTEKEIRAEVEKAKKFTPKLSEFTIATSGQKDAKIDEVERAITEEHINKELFSVHVWNWVDILERLNDFPNVIKKYYPQFIDNSLISDDIVKAITKKLAEKYYPSQGSLVEDIHRNIKTFDLFNLADNVDSLKRLINASDDYDINFDTAHSGKFKLVPKKSKSNKEGLIKGKVIVEVPEEFKAFPGLLKYSYQKQKPLRLNTIGFELSIGDKIFEQFKSQEETGKDYIVLDLKTDMPCEITIDNHSKENIKNEFIIHPKKFPPPINIDIENGQLVKLITNVDLRLERIDEKNDELVHVLSNKDQKNNFIYFRLFLQAKRIGNGNSYIVYNNSSFDIQPKKDAKSYHNMIISKAFLELTKTDRMVLRDTNTLKEFCSFGKFIFTGKQFLTKLSEFWEAIFKIEEHFKIEINIPATIDYKDFYNVIDINNILHKGIIKRNYKVTSINSTLTITSLERFKHFIMEDGDNDFSMVLQRKNSNETIFGQELNKIGRAHV